MAPTSAKDETGKTKTMAIQKYDATKKEDVVKPKRMEKLNMNTRRDER